VMEAAPLPLSFPEILPTNKSFRFNLTHNTAQNTPRHISHQ
jgi:hypothetical protein